MNNVKKAPQPVGRARAVSGELVETCPDPARLLALYYWNTEAELLETLHRYLALPEQPREALRAFLTMVADNPESVAVSVNQNGDVTLSPPAVAQLMNKMDARRANSGPRELSH